MQYSIGTILDGKVNNITANGVYVTIDNETFGFLPNNKMPSYLNAEGKFAGVKYDRIRVVVEDIRQDGMLLFCDFDYWVKLQVAKEFSSRYEPGTIFPCEVKSVSDSTATVLVSNTVEGYINKDQLGWNAINKVSDVLYVGEPINAVFIGTDNVRILFGLKYLQKKPYDDSLYDLSLDDLLKYCGHSGTEFVGECHKRGPYVFLENLYSINPGEEGKILTDKKYGYNLRAIVPGNNSSLVEGNFYKFKLTLVPKETRLERNQLFQFRAANISPVNRNPFSNDVLKAFKKNISPYTNITASHLLAEVGKNMYSSKDRMFFELIQNADDASPENGVSVTVKTEGDYLTIVHNGFSFDREDFEAISSAANGTKKANENKTGYKGIGFKSVFTDSQEVLIKTGGYQFKYQKDHPVFNNFEKFYFFVNELSTQDQKDRFLARFSSERAKFKGVSDIPWQLEPIWVKKEAFPALTAFQSGANVAIALKLGEDTINDEKGYRKAIEAVIDKPKFMLFLRNTNRIDFNERSASKEIDGNRILLKNSFGTVRQELFERKDFLIDTSDETFSEKGFDIKRKIENEEDGKIIEASFVNSRNQEYENIPKKLAISKSTEITFAVKVDSDEQEHIHPDTSCSEVSMFAFLPTLVKEFRFPFFINANFVLDSPRQHILSDNPWNRFLMGEIAELIVKWCAELCERREPNALDVLPKTFFNESETDIAELSEAFNKRYKSALDRVPFILCGDNKPHIPSEVVIDKTGLAKIVGESVFCNILGSTKHIPSNDIECSVLDNDIFASVEKVNLSNLVTLLNDNTKINAWYKSATKNDQEAFLSWLDKNSESLKTIIPSLNIFKFGEVMVSSSEITIEKSRIITTDKINPIKSVLEKIGFSCTVLVDDESKLSPFAPKQSLKKLFEALPSKEKLGDLTTDEKLLLIKHFASVESIDSSSISALSLFHNESGIIKPMNSMIAYVDDSPEWIKPFMIKKDENSEDIQSYLIPADRAFEKLILPNLTSVQTDIKTLYRHFKWTDAKLSKKVVDILKQEDKLASFIDIVKDLGKDTKEYYLQNITKLDISEEKGYSKDSFEYKVLQLAIDTYEDPSVFSDYVFIGEKCLKEFSIKDDVKCEYTTSSSSVLQSVMMSLSRLLPSYVNQSDKIDDVKALFDSSLAWDKLVKAKRKTAQWVEGELNKSLGIVHASYEPWKKNAGNAQQYLFSVYRRRLQWSTVKGFAIKLEDESDEFINEMMDFLYTKNLTISTSPFTCKITGYFTKKFFDNDYIFVDEQLLPAIERWADDDDKRKYLIKNGIRDVDDDIISFRKAFISDQEFKQFDDLSDTDKKNSIEFLVDTNFVQWPVSGKHQVDYVTRVLSLKYTPLNQSIDSETLERESSEMTTTSYLNWIANSYPRIFLYDGNMPMNVTYSGYSVVLLKTSSGSYYYDTSKKIVYIDKNEDIDELMFDLARGSKVPFNLDDYRAVFRVGMTAVSKEELQQTQQKIDELTSELTEKERLLLRYRQRYGDIDAKPTPPSQSPESQKDATIKKGDREGLSLSERTAAQLEAQQFLKQTQPKWEFPEHYAEANEEGEPFHYSTVDVIDENGVHFPIVLKSHKADGEPLKINTFEWESISRDNARIFVYTGNDIKEIDVMDLVRNQPTINVSFSTENLDIEERISAFADSLRYFKELHFDFDSFNLTKQARSLAGMYNENERRQGATSDKTDL